MNEAPVRRGAEAARLAASAARRENWKRWGPYLAERQWGTVREDYSETGACWDYLPHDHARSRAYRWGEDGLLGICDRRCRLCLAVALWNGKDPILKERLFGLTGPEGNHGEDVKEEYYYLDSTPTHSYMRGLYKYPHAAFPYDRLVAENKARDRDEPEYEIRDTGVFDGGRYFDVCIEYAKAAPDDILMRITVTNRGPEAARLHVLPTLWFRNTWSWGGQSEDKTGKPELALRSPGRVDARHEQLGQFEWRVESAQGGAAPIVFTENESNKRRLFDQENASEFVKDAFHSYLVDGKADAVNPADRGTKAAAVLAFEIPAGEAVVVRARLRDSALETADAFGAAFEGVFDARIAEADDHCESCLGVLGVEERRVASQAWAGLMWSKQFYHYGVREWLDGDPAQPPPPAARRAGRNSEWGQLYCRDVLSMPDKWEYPWFAAWDLAFQAVAIARVDPHFAKDQLLLLMREWYMSPSGQIPAYEFAFGDVNPPVHAWACWRVYKMTGRRGKRDRGFLERAFHKLLINFTWWVNRKDPHGRNIFAGGFLGMDNVGVFDRSMKLPEGVYLDQADATAWMAFFCGTMLSMALELAQEDIVYEDVASKFFEHYIGIVDAMNHAGGSGLWDEEDGFYYDRLVTPGREARLKVRSMVGLVPLLAVEVIEAHQFLRLPGFSKRAMWFKANRKDLSRQISYMNSDGLGDEEHRLLAVPSRERLMRLVSYLMDESEFLSPYGVRSLSKYHEAHPYTFEAQDREFSVAYTPGESNTDMFGGNSNWRGPVWMPMNYLLVEALERYHHFYRDNLRVEFPKGSGKTITLQEAAWEIRSRLCRIFLPRADGARPCHGGERRYADDPACRDLVLFHEFFHGETGQGLGASHQTGWTALVAVLLEDAAKERKGSAGGADL